MLPRKQTPSNNDYVKQKVQMLKRSIFNVLTGFLHSNLPYIINHHIYLSCFMQLYNRMNAQVLVFLYPCDFELTSRSVKLYHTKFETNQFTSDQTNDDVNCIFLKNHINTVLSLEYYLSK